MEVVMVVVPFLVGAIPFSVLIGRVLKRVDIRNWGDRNPGATNAWRAGGWPLGVMALILDFSKGLSGIALARFLGGSIPAWLWCAAAVSPVFGHAFSPFLGFKGGKALATTWGVWTAATGWYGPFALGFGASLSMSLAKPSPDWIKVMVAFSALGLSMILAVAPGKLWAVFLVNLAVVMFKQWQR